MADSAFELPARVTVLEGQHKRLLDDNAKILAEIRAMREDLRTWSTAISNELVRVYDRLMEK